MQLILRLFIVAFVAVLGAGPVSAQSLAVPVEFRDIHDTLRADIASFEQTIDARWDGARHPVAFAAPLSSANANLGPTLLTRPFQSVLLELDGLRAMGVRTSLVEAPFPVFYRPYYPSDAEYQQYLNFYVRVANEVRARGMKLILDSAFLLSRPPGDVAYIDPGTFYRSLTWEQYQAARAENARLALQTLRPDFLVVLQEPDTEATATGFAAAGTAAGSTALLKTILAGIEDVRGATRIGAGVGSWQEGYTQFILNFGTTSIDFIDLHVFQANFDFLPQAVDMADLAAQAGKGLAISGAWLTKSRDAEVMPMAIGTLSDDVALARDPFACWAPLDGYFLNVLMKFAHWRQMEFFAPFFSQYLRAYLPYDSTTASLTPAQILYREQQQHVQSLGSGTYSTSGTSYSAWLLDSPDVVPPSPPSGGTAVAGVSKNVTVYWKAASDNVGVAGYVVYRNGVAVARTVYPYFQDSGRTSGTSYTYSVRSFDVAGNFSSLSSAGAATAR